ncbi:MAG TPA: thermonuclease family protein [Steroidobacteraceae bacterium]|nr:thermonuclease family protein [Steroidobacteraceae bacterium]
MGLLACGANPRLAAVVMTCVAFANAAPARGDDALAATVTGVVDGDTIKVQLPDGPVIVRLRNIDAPELNQSGGGAATRALHERLVGLGISLRDVTRQSDQLWVAVVYLGDENINAWLVKQGHAWAYRGQTREADYCAWEQAARSLRRGLWADKHWTAPWDWRTSKQDAGFFASDFSNATAASCMRSISETPAFDD